MTGKTGRKAALSTTRHDVKGGGEEQQRNGELEAVPRCEARSGLGARCELPAGHPAPHRGPNSEWLTPPPGWNG